MTSSLAIWSIAGLSTLGVLVRPFAVPEYLWAGAGAVLLLALGLISPPTALVAVGRGTDVYLFLAGMMILAELARVEGLFAYLAAMAVRRAKGSSWRLFVLVYAIGALVTVFLSNDATAVVLTPAVYAATRAARVEPLPYLFICAFVANAASFVLPISNPANLVIYGAGMPQLGIWLNRFGPAALVAILATFGALAFTQRHALSRSKPETLELPALSGAGRWAAAGIGAAAIVLITASAFGSRLGLPTFLAASVTATIVLGVTRKSPRQLFHAIAWDVLLLVACLFVLVEALSQTGSFSPLAHFLAAPGSYPPAPIAALAGVGAAALSNLANNLPVGLVVAALANLAPLPHLMRESLLIGIDLGPNLSVTGSLATLLWLVALRREGVKVTSWQFLKLGLVVMLPALILALLVLQL